jgi:hypothetical protein
MVTKNNRKTRNNNLNQSCTVRKSKLRAEIEIISSVNSNKKKNSILRQREQDSNKKIM